MITFSFLALTFNGTKLCCCAVHGLSRRVAYFEYSGVRYMCR